MSVLVQGARDRAFVDLEHQTVDGSRPCPAVALDSPRGPSAALRAAAHCAGSYALLDCRGCARDTFLMGDSIKALRQVLMGEVAGATVTRADLAGDGTLALDPALMSAAGFVEHEKVELYDATCGTRLSIPVVSGAKGAVAVSGAAAHLVHQGDVVAVAAYGWVKVKAAARHSPLRVKVDGQNRVVSRAGGAAPALETKEPRKEKKAPEPITLRRSPKKGA